MDKRASDPVFYATLEEQIQQQRCACCTHRILRMGTGHPFNPRTPFGCELRMTFPDCRKQSPGFELEEPE